MAHAEMAHVEIAHAEMARFDGDGGRSGEGAVVLDSETAKQILAHLQANTDMESGLWRQIESAILSARSKHSESPLSAGWGEVRGGAGSGAESIREERGEGDGREGRAREERGERGAGTRASGNGAKQLPLKTREDLSHPHPRFPQLAAGRL